MEISNIASRLTSLAGATPRADAPPIAAAAIANAASQTSPGEKLKDVLGQYDLQKITPREFSELLQKLRDTKSVSDSELKDLQQSRLELDGQHADPDEPLNLVQFLAQRLSAAQSTAGTNTSEAPVPADAASNVQSLQRQLSALQRLVAVQTGAAASGVDTLA